MVWLDVVTSIEAGAGFILASFSAAYLLRLAGGLESRARRIGAAALAVVSGGLALEAVLFLGQAPVDGSLPRSAAVLVVRSALLISAALIAGLILRHGRWRR
jgi:hypothetical protein